MRHTPSDRYIAEQLSFLDALSARGIRSDLSVMRKALGLLDHPEERVATVIVGGTNGKGSTASMIGNIVRHAEYSVGCYYSPHVRDVRERIELDGRMIPKDDMARLIADIRERTEGIVEPTYFEFLTLSAYYWFAKKKVDLAVMEVGMGGRFDATNVANPLVSVITSVSLDHTQYLGSTIEEIAREKVQIVPVGGTLVAGRVDGTVRTVLRDHVRDRAARAYFLGEDFRTDIKTGTGAAESVSLDYRGMTMELADIETALVGNHQADNAAVAIAATEVLGTTGFSIGEGAVRGGIAEARLLGRIQRITDSPEIIVDVAHNPAGARVLADHIRGLPTKRTAFVVGMMGDKDIGGFLREIEQAADMVLLAPPKVDRAAPADTLGESAADLKKPSRVCRDIPAAVAAAKQVVGTDGRVVITGSFYTVQEAMRVVPGGS